MFSTIDLFVNYDCIVYNTMGDEMINYPNGNHKASVKELNSHARRGMSLEDDLNSTNQYYRDNNIAIVYKKPTPITIVNVDYPKRSAAKITEAYFQLPSTTDYNGIYKGNYIDFEAKQTQNKTSFPLSMIHQHQIDHLQSIINHGGIAFLIVRFTAYDETYFVKAIDFINKINEHEALSIKYEWFKENGILIKYNYKIKVDYINCLNSTEVNNEEEKEKFI